MKSGAAVGHENGSRSAAPEKPALLKGGMVVCWIYAAVLAVFLLLLPNLADIAKGSGAAASNLPGMPPALTTAEQAEFLDTTRWFFIPLLAVSTIVAFGLAKDRHWSRWTMMLLLVLGIVLIPPQMANATEYAVSAGLAGFGWWYLYRKPNVVEYYREISRITTKSN